jgi:hypothetical protein
MMSSFRSSREFHCRCCFEECILNGNTMKYVISDDGTRLSEVVDGQFDDPPF